MTFGQLIECVTCEIFFFKRHAENEAGKLVLDLFCFLRQLYIKTKQAVTLASIYFGRPPPSMSNKNKLYKISDC